MPGGSRRCSKRTTRGPCKGLAQSLDRIVATTTCTVSTLSCNPIISISPAQQLKPNQVLLLRTALNHHFTNFHTGYYSKSVYVSYSLARVLGDRLHCQCHLFRGGRRCGWEEVGEEVQRSPLSTARPSSRRRHGKSMQQAQPQLQKRLSWRPVHEPQGKNKSLLLCKRLHTACTLVHCRLKSNQAANSKAQLCQGRLSVHSWQFLYHFG